MLWGRIRELYIFSSLIWVNAVWPDFWESAFEVWPAPGKPSHHTDLRAFQGPRGRPDLTNVPQTNPTRLPSGTQLFILAFGFHNQISYFSFHGGTENVTKLLYNLFPGLIRGAFCTIFRARPVGTGLGAKFGRKPAKNP